MRFLSRANPSYMYLNYVQVVLSQNNAFFMYFLPEQGKVEEKRTNGES